MVATIVSRILSHRPDFLSTADDAKINVGSVAILFKNITNVLIREKGS